MRHAPSPRALPLINHFHHFLGNRLDNILALQKNYGDIVRLKLGPLVTHLVMHPDYARHVLVTNAKNYHKGRVFKKTESYFGQGVATSDGDLWRTQRRLMNPHFKTEALGDFFRTKVEVVELALDRFSKMRQSIDLSMEFPRIAMEVVARTLFGQHVDNARIHGIIHHVDHILKHTMKMIILPFSIPKWMPMPSNIRFHRGIDDINRTIFSFIDHARSKELQSNSLLSALAHTRDPETGERMSVEQIRDEAMTMFLGGIDTTGNTLPWVLAMLLKNPASLSEVKQEISEVLGDAPPDFTSIRRLEKLHNAILETLRLYPQNYVMARDTHNDDEIGGYFIPKDTTVFISMYAIHRHKDFWPEAEVFDLSRFTAESMKDRHQNAYNPFGAGQRKCIGSNFALIEMTTILAMMLQRFHIKVDDDARISPNPLWSLPMKHAFTCTLTPKSHA